MYEIIPTAEKIIGQILLSEETIAKRIKEMANQITKDFNGESIVAIVVMRGAFFFASDLCKQIKLPMKLDFLSASSYGDGQETSGKVKLANSLREDITGKNVLIIDDMIDTGKTMKKLIDYLKAFNPKSIKLCVLCEKKSNNTEHITPDYCGFDIEDHFLIGYGLDYKGFLRNIPYIGIINDKFKEA
ncbi:MAG: hypoxanthine phosphoribosyltransferase [Candidatus Riflebacteria bacterium]|nr:hypoxanthine phosphoribosyltransferase [Candidatus Riflebacteria bacterium]